MAFSVFLSYSVDPDEQAIVWRIQTLAAAQGIQVFVPPRAGTRLPSSRHHVMVDEQARKAIDQSDCVLAIITSRTDSAVQKELNYARGKGKLIIPIVEQEVTNNAFLSEFTPVFRFSRWNSSPGKVETEISQFLLRQKLDKDMRQGLGAIVGIGLGLFVLASLAKK
jgi:nucleoside 2-deoxyribosyltransferase